MKPAEPHWKESTEETYYPQKNRLKNLLPRKRSRGARFAATGGLGELDRTLSLSQN